MQGLNFFGGDPPRSIAFEQAYQAEVTQEAARIVILSELWLDQAGTLESLDAILTGMTRPCLPTMNAPEHAIIPDLIAGSQPAPALTCVTLTYDFEVLARCIARIVS